MLLIMRVMTAYGISTIGGSDWYLEGAYLLLRDQYQDGSWDSSGGRGGPALPLKGSAENRFSVTSPTSPFTSSWEGILTPYIRNIFSVTGHERKSPGSCLSTEILAL